MKKEKITSDQTLLPDGISPEMSKDDYIRSLELANQILRHEVEGLRSKLTQDPAKGRDSSIDSSDDSDSDFSDCPDENSVILHLHELIAQPFGVLECNIFLPDAHSAHRAVADVGTSATLPSVVAHFEEEGVVDWIAEGRISKITPDLEQSGELLNTNILSVPIYLHAKYFGLFSARVSQDFAPEMIPEIENLLESATHRLDAIRNSSAIDEMNAKIEALTRQMQMSSLLASIGELTSTFSHEIDAPLEIIRANLNFLELGLGNTERRVQIIKEQTEKILAINNRLKKASEISNNNADLSVVEIAGLIDEAIMFSGTQLLSHGIKIDKQLESGHLNVLARRTQIEQALIKILLNACTAMPDGGTISIVAFRASNRTISISVQDTGFGFSKTELDNMFDIGTVDKTGYSLGLFMVKNVLEQNSGTISIVSEPGRGTTVKITLPEMKTEVKKK
jgi:signal transduction histidine kinase